jgi:hypothetical protein
MKNELITSTEAILRQQRIAALGAFGKRREEIVCDKTKYSRKIKHKASAYKN